MQRVVSRRAAERAEEWSEGGYSNLGGLGGSAWERVLGQRQHDFDSALTPPLAASRRCGLSASCSGSLSSSGDASGCWRTCRKEFCRPCRGCVVIWGRTQRSRAGLSSAGPPGLEPRSGDNVVCGAMEVDLSIWSCRHEGAEGVGVLPRRFGSIRVRPRPRHATPGTFPCDGWMNVVMASNRMALGRGLVSSDVKKMTLTPSATIQSHRNLYDR
jgi:hypothetical protein